MNDIGPVAVVTGAGGALGGAVAQQLAAQGYQLVLVDNDPVALGALSAALPAGSTSQAVVGDVTREDDVKRYVEVARAVGDGTIRSFLNNAGVEGSMQPLVDYSLEAFDRVMAVNVRGVFLGLKLLGPHLVGGGAVVNTSSTGGVVGATNMAGYIASKHAVVGLTRAAALEWAARNVRVNAVCPGPMEGRMMDSIAAGLGVPDVESIVSAKIPIQRLATADEVARTVLFLLGDESTYTTGSAVVVDGGRSA
ncbi:putative Levodione reductase [metagenome]|uniref:Putative Levodione reductase n=1 Tax=metagenome TaxID=256318 RepID=A0A2P2CA90_9ZZZZ